MSLVILLYLAFYSLHFQKVTGAKTFSICMFIFSFWVVCNGLEMAGTDLPTKLFWANMQYFAYTTIHIFWLYMVLQFTASAKWTRLRRILPLFIIPLIFIILVWTDQYHGLIRYGFSLDYSGSFPVIKKSYGPLYWIHPIYGYSIELISILLIARAAIFLKSIYRRQAIALLVSPIISIVPSILYVFKLSPVNNIDITPVFLGISGIVAAVGLFRYQLFAINPIAREVAVDNMNIGMLVIDSHDIVADINKCARQQLGCEENSVVGAKVEDVISKINIKWSYLLNNSLMEYRAATAQTPEERYYEVQRLPVYSKQDIRAGNVILIRDVTEIRIAQKYILDQNSKLAVSAEREKLARDLHDNLGQVFGFINLQAQGIQNELSYADTEKINQDLEKLVAAGQAAHKEIRNYIHTVRNAPTKVDFETEIKKEIEAFRAHTKIDVFLDITGIDVWNEIEGNPKTILLNILKEALNNIRKHARNARHAIVSFRCEKDRLCCTIEDDGDGFDADAISDGQFGLRIMRERAFEIGADIEIDTQPGEGTRILLKIPCTKRGDMNAIQNPIG
ncbi:MAG TPA: histidine kinase N-terminal 7TM domain-containing protein [Candidatus Limiplasma sp.]|nr:histidine kinase N-terminal 7TM domain-containing protein [Candidatus Limiplasma sp.]